MKKLLKKLESDNGMSTDIEVSVSVTDAVAEVEDTNEVIDEMTEEASVIEEAEETSVTLEGYKTTITSKGLPASTMAIIESTGILGKLVDASSKSKTLPASESLDIVGDNVVEAEEVVTLIDEVQDETLVDVTEESFEKFVALANKLEAKIYKSTKRQLASVNAVLELVEGTTNDKVEDAIEDNSATPLEGAANGEIIEIEATIENAPASEQPEELSESDLAEVLTSVAEPQEQKTVPDTDIVDKGSAVEYLTRCKNIVEKANSSTISCLRALRTFASDESIKTLSASERINKYYKHTAYCSGMINRNRKMARRAVKSAQFISRILNNDGSIINVEEPLVTYTPGTGMDS